MATQKRLPRKIIQGSSVRDYAYLWSEGGCLLHQWCSGARGIDDAVIAYVAKLLKEVQDWKKLAAQRKVAKVYEAKDSRGLQSLLTYLRDNKGHPAERYISDEWER